MKIKLSLILILLLFPYAIQSQQINPADSKTSELQAQIEAQNNRIQRLDSTITQLKNENSHLKDLAEQDIDHAKSLINVIEIILGFIAVLLAVFTVVGAYAIRELLRQSNQIKQDHRIIKQDWEKIREEIEGLKEASLKEGKDLLEILFYITEGDSKFANNPEEAISLYNKALKIRSDNPEIYAKLGHANLEIGRYNQAISQLDKGYKIASNNST